MKGYTLVEMLVAMAVVAICASLLVPGVEKVKAGAQRSACVSNLRQIGQASLLYHADQETILPWCKDPGDTYWWMSLAPYVGTDTKVFHCPSDKGFLSQEVARTISYGWNYKLAGHGDTGINGDDFVRLPMYPKPAQVLIATDGSSALSGQQDSWGFVDEATWHTADPKRHAGLGNALFLDGHVETLPTTQFPNNPLYQDRTQHLP